MKYDLVFDPPLMNAAGSLGFAPAAHGTVDLAPMGAFVTNPISLEPRSPAQGRRFISYPGGFLLHTGYPNPGMRTALRRYAAGWARSPCPVIVHLLCRRADEVARLVGRLEGSPGVVGLELGLPPDVSEAEAIAMIQAAAGELPVIARLPLERAAGLAEAIMRQKTEESMLAAFSLGPPRGVLPIVGSGLVRGRLYGPAIFPLALAALQEVRKMGLPVIGAGGIYDHGQVESMLEAGALAVQVDAVLWRGGL
jgi:dihydroorotate dehydrogenase (NAD+) catalytic subunit